MDESKLCAPNMASSRQVQKKSKENRQGNREKKMINLASFVLVFFLFLVFLFLLARTVSFSLALTDDRWRGLSIFSFKNYIVIIIHTMKHTTIV